MKLTWKQAREMGIDLPRKSGKGKKPERMGGPGPKHVGLTPAQKLFLEMCQAHGLPAPVEEYPFAKEIGRDWRFDWLFEGYLALEIEGGAHTHGRHTRGVGFLGDVEKYNEAGIAGYVVLRCTPQDVKSGAAFALVRRALEANGRPVVPRVCEVRRE